MRRSAAGGMCPKPGAARPYIFPKLAVSAGAQRQGEDRRHLRAAGESGAGAPYAVLSAENPKGYQNPAMDGGWKERRIIPTKYLKRISLQNIFNMV